MKDKLYKKAQLKLKSGKKFKRTCGACKDKSEQKIYHDESDSTEVTLHEEDSEPIEDKIVFEQA